MQGSLSLLVLSAMCVVLSVTTPCLSNPSAGGGLDSGRPARPEVFSSPEELRTYLDQLSNYFAIAGRPRFGKRLAPSGSFRPNMMKPESNSLKMNNNNNPMKLATSSDVISHRYPSPSNDLYDLLYQYDE